MSASDHHKTRHSLILRLPTADDAQAWEEFASIYEPLLYRFARNRGLQDADACELVQDVMVAVARAVKDWEPDDQRGKFRAWLFRIAKHRLIDRWRRTRLDIATGDTANHAMLEQVMESDGLSDSIETEHRRELFRTVAALVREEVKQNTWLAFWKTSIEQLAVEEVAGQLGMSVGAVYIARSRVLHRLRLHIEKWESNDA